MASHRPDVLVVAGNKQWRDSYALEFVAGGCLVTMAKDGLPALDILHHHSFDVIVADDSCADLAPVEFLFNARDLSPNGPVILLGGKDLEQFRQVWAHYNVFFAGPKEELLSAIPSSIEKARLRSAESVGGSVKQTH